MRIKIISLNIWDIPFWFAAKRQERIPRLGEFFKNQDADIICFQESFDVKHRKDLHEFLGKNNYTASESDANGKTRRVLLFKRFDLTGGLVTFSKLPVKKSHFVRYRRFVDMMFSEYIGRKGVLETVIETPRGPIMVMNTHLHHGWTSVDHRFRLKQLRQLIKATKAVKNMPIIAAGDFNENDMFKEKDFSHLLKKAGFEDPARGEKEEARPTIRVGNHYSSKTWFNRNRKSSRIDYIITKDLEKFGWKIAEFKVLDQPKSPLSDHDPVMLVIK
jgi:endonuclease/exonuclease/phosphatase family metal-dependent hydrolase